MGENTLKTLQAFGSDKSSPHYEEIEQAKWVALLEGKVSVGGFFKTIEGDIQYVLVNAPIDPIERLEDLYGRNVELKENTNFIMRYGSFVRFCGAVCREFVCFEPFGKTSRGGVTVEEGLDGVNVFRVRLENQIRPRESQFAWTVEELKQNMDANPTLFGKVPQYEEALILLVLANKKRTDKGGFVLENDLGHSSFNHSYVGSAINASRLEGQVKIYWQTPAKEKTELLTVPAGMSQSTLKEILKKYKEEFKNAN